MPSYQRDLGGFPGLLLIGFVFVSVLALVVRRKLRLVAARREEVRRLLILAEEESARAEYESGLVYSYDLGVSAAVSGGGEGQVRQCAVCYSPTTTRCSRCKAIRYCSGKCQIIHWRQGHKDECRPPPSDIQHDAPGSNPELKDTCAESKLSDDISDSLAGKCTETEHVGHASFDSFHSSEIFSKEDDVEIRNVVDKPGTDSSYESSGSFTVLSSGNSAFALPVERLDAASVYDDCPLSNPKCAEKPLPCDVTSTNSKITSEACDPPSESATTTIPVNSTTCSSKLNQQKSGRSVKESGCGPSVGSNSFGSGDCANYIHSNDLGGNQDVTLKSSLNYTISQGGLSKSKSCKNDVSPQLDSSSSSHFSFSRSGNGIPSQTSTRNGVQPDGPILFKSAGVSMARESLSHHSDASAHVSSGSTDEHLLKSRWLKTSANVSSTNETYTTGGNHVSSGKPLTRPPTPPTDLPVNTSSGSNGGYALKSSVRRAVQQLKTSKPPKPYEMLSPYDLFIQLYNEKVDLQPCGLINCGNSCYANAVLQCLAFTRPLTTYLIQGLHSKTCPKKDWCFTCEFESLVVKAKQGKSPLSPIGILSQIHNIGSHLGHGKEEDAHEFLRYAIDTMQSNCLKEAGKNAVGPLTEETTLIQLIFGGYLQSKIRCMRCQGSSERCERMMDLTVEIHGDVRTLDAALSRFTATEVLDGENKYQCSRCKSYERAKKRLKVLEAPNVLTIALKRFQSGKFGKLNKEVQFPEILNLTKYMSSRACDTSPIYCLYAVVVHVDIMNAAFSGHYVCYVKNTQGKWYKIDDSTVKPVELDRVLSKGAYMLLYARCSPRAPSLIRNAMPCGSGKHKGRKHQDAIPSNSRDNVVFKSRFDPDRRADSLGHFDHLDPYSGRFFPQDRTSKVDSSSDSSSLLSCSDEGSCSTESTRDSASTDDYSDYKFGDSGRSSWNSPSRASEDSDGFGTYSPSKHSYEAISNWQTSGFSSSGNSTSDLSSLSEEDACRMRGINYENMQELDRVGMWRHQDHREVFLQDKESSLFLPSDTTKHCRKLTEQCSNRETDRDNPCKGMSGLFKRRTTKDGTAQTVYRDV